jgi:N-acetyl-anhydromuramyl-L-alanine amidase AmpD
MSGELNFEAMPFEAYETVAPEQSGFELEEEFGRRTPWRRPGFSPRPRPVLPKRRAKPPAFGWRRPKKPPARPPRFPPGRPKWPRPPSGAVAGPYPLLTEPYGVGPEPYPAEPPPADSEYMRWVQSALNDVLGLRLPVNGAADPATRSAIRSFQQRNGLPADGVVGPDTERALIAARRGQSPRRGATGPNGSDMSEPSGPGAAPSQPDAAEPMELGLELPAEEFGFEWENFGDQFEDAEGESAFEAKDESFGDILGSISSGIGSAYGRGMDELGGATGSRIIDLTAQADKNMRKGKRDPKTVYALVLHQMACCFKPRDPLRRFLSLGAHFAILPDGRILQLHPVSALIWASDGFNKRSVAVEFAGNFPSVAGKWWKGDTYGKNHPTQAQYEAGRYLIRHLMRTIGLTHVVAHRQSSGTRENDPGPDIWSQVGQWAVDTLGLKDGGAGFKIGTGNPIPDAWRTWGRRAVAPVMRPELEAELSETELAHDMWQGEYHAHGSEFVRWVQRMLNEVSGLRLPVDGVDGPATRSAIRNFQRRHGLPVSGIVEAETEFALKAAVMN